MKILEIGIEEEEATEKNILTLKLSVGKRSYMTLIIPDDEVELSFQLSCDEASDLLMIARNAICEYSFNAVYFLDKLKNFVEGYHKRHHVYGSSYDYNENKRKIRYLLSSLDYYESYVRESIERNKYIDLVVYRIAQVIPYNYTINIGASNMLTGIKGKHRDVVVRIFGRRKTIRPLMEALINDVYLRKMLMEHVILEHIDDIIEIEVYNTGLADKLLEKGVPLCFINTDNSVYAYMCR